MKNEHNNDEVLQRMRRVETRIWKICERLGVEDPPHGKFLVDEHGIDVPGHDCSLGRLCREIKNAGFPIKGHSYDIDIAGEPFATIVFF